MKLALLMRGHCQRRVGTLRPWGIDYRRCIETQLEFTINPMKSLGELDVYLSSYTEGPGAGFHPMSQEQVEKDYGATTVFWSSGPPNQRANLLDGLRLITEPYDLIVVTRFDVAFLQSPITHEGADLSKFNFLWKEWEKEHWDNHRRTPDAIHIFPGKYLKAFQESVAEMMSDVCIHHVYPHLATRIGEENINLILKEGYYMSSTDDRKNPFYILDRVRE